MRRTLAEPLAAAPTGTRRHAGSPPVTCAGGSGVGCTWIGWASRDRIHPLQPGLQAEQQARGREPSEWAALMGSHHAGYGGVDEVRTRAKDLATVQPTTIAA
ncbi:hypothetical protein ACFH04_41925 [Streptomyces noboritoensis]|uniref:Uncharacterized protein n=1 Tax=Streptomyces noboritoensis TaxID=67337 RepID=A0ABV6U0L7_9ACTN